MKGICSFVGNVVEYGKCKFKLNCAYPYCGTDYSEPLWVCMDCAEDRGATVPENRIVTTRLSNCGICGEIKDVAEPNNFGFTRSKLRVKNE